MGDENRKPTRSEVIRDRPRAPQSLHGEGGPKIDATEAEHRQRGGTVEEPPEHGYKMSDAVSGAGALTGEDMGPDERDDADVLREEDVTEADRLSDDVRESVVPTQPGQPGPGQLHGEDMAPSERIDGD